MRIHFLCCINILFLLRSSHAQPHHHHGTAMNYLEPLIGAQKGNSTQGISKLKNHLSNLGYLNTNPQSVHTHDLFDDHLEQALHNYQSFFKLPFTGALDATTLAHMRQPRCGVRDTFRPNMTAKFSFFPGMPKWPAGRRSLTYSFPPGTRNNVCTAIRDATNIWARVAPFSFRYTRNFNSADIKISVQNRDHGDGQAFDGGGGILAHATAPTGGMLHFDGDERWVNGVEAGAMDLQTVGLHELGHVLGLGHSADSSSLMYPTVNYGSRKGLGNDDIRGITTLYSS